MKIGFVGLGAMGRGMARNLVRAGFPTAVFDVRPDVVRELESDGARSAADAAEVVVGAELVCIAVFDDRQVRQVLAGDGSGPGVLSAASPGTIVALHTTAQVWLKDMSLAGVLSRSHDVAAPVLECLLSDVAPTVRAEGLTG
jgi:3-hydroxyisobutyrate dehydrogenase-like beta-hydroxyacid dehydrogenase